MTSACELEPILANTSFGLIISTMTKRFDDRDSKFTILERTDSNDSLVTALGFGQGVLTPVPGEQKAQFNALGSSFLGSEGSSCVFQPTILMTKADDQLLIQQSHQKLLFLFSPASRVSTSVPLVLTLVLSLVLLLLQRESRDPRAELEDYVEEHHSYVYDRQQVPYGSEGVSTG
ncbi:hypothetical protein BC939DRAFT_482075 [Gamsiella multidivaricata]|uniref:uncharacterized protein n=1 Tax=Gamsiella multidivaricata TaxID=101098 RepID=UPI00221F22EF|nr:uncharacterized protein BC939DRAFT_482075 [Gamsiella multidivaricata]KAI7816375.1 hypothetical protein BC939DRAFT_482075 [Gamsiella multidivaricata]